MLCEEEEEEISADRPIFANKSTVMIPFLSFCLSLSGDPDRDKRNRKGRRFPSLPQPKKKRTI